MLFLPALGGTVLNFVLHAMEFGDDAPRTVKW